MNLAWPMELRIGIASGRGRTNSLATLPSLLLVMGIMRFSNILFSGTNFEAHVLPDKPAKSLLERKSGTGRWLASDDELTLEWLKNVEEYRSACDAADQEESPDNGVAGGAAS